MASTDTIPLVVMTSDQPRHRFLANSLAARFAIRGVVSEAKRPRPAGTAPEENALIREHFAGWDAAERAYFGMEERFAVAPENILVVPRGESSSPAVFEWVMGRAPRYLVLFGTSIVRDPLLSAFEDRAINMHLGLSPYYRGTATNFWPLADGLPECVGITVHLAAAEVDAGPILAQTRPVMAPGDSSHDIGCKAIIAGVELLARAIAAYDAGSITPAPQRLGGKLFRQRDFSPEAVRTLRENFAGGMIQHYLAEKSERDIEFPIIS